MIGVLDIFAGPGGLAEGFSAFATPAGRYPFDIHLSIEKDPRAYETLRLRSFVRQFRGGALPANYCARLKEGAEGVQALYSENLPEALRSSNEAWLAELGSVSDDDVDSRIRKAIPKNSDWILIGGPPCQAYSLVGRSRMTADKKKYDSDPRHYLYRQYLRLLKVHRPAAFVMENVKGLLSSEVHGKKTFDNILRDLRGQQYRLYSLVTGREYTGGDEESAADFVIRSEFYGIPQRRHRIIILGVRDDLKMAPTALIPQMKFKTVRDVIGSAPPLYSTISRGHHTVALLIHTLKGVRSIGTSHMTSGSAFKTHLQSAVDRTISQLEAMGDSGLREAAQMACRQHNHEARSHMASDLQRYLYASAFADFYGRSPSLADFPIRLLPDHENVASGVAGDTFADRFRVQCWDNPSTTVTSHIAKDGHYFIHPDPTQFRSLSVREAARLQTFPDSYFFMGPRTSQYQQVGNAVPPELARQIAGVVFEMFSGKGGYNG